MIAILFLLGIHISKVLANDCEAFKIFAQSMDDYKFDFTKDCCEFEEITCNSQKQITELVIINRSSYSLETLSKEIGNLKNLEKLDLHGNKLDKAIPNSIGNLTKLKFLDLSHNYFEDYIPYEFKNLVNLEV
eukprot:jgi/Orpsp1_1/1189505/evm.model.d7180000072504.1